MSSTLAYAFRILAFTRKRLHLFRWLLPLFMALLVFLYEAVPSNYMHNHFTPAQQMIADVLVYGTVGPLLVFLLLDLMERWITERETSDYQSHLISAAQEKVDESRRLSDNALQALFSAGTLISTLRASQNERSLEKAADLDATEQALDKAVTDLRNHLLAS